MLRRFLSSFVATVATLFTLLLTVPTPPVQAQTAPWKDYLGANTGGSFSTEVWRATTRGGYPRGSNGAALTSTIDPAKLDALLAANDWIHLQDGYNYRQQSDVDTFFNAVRADRGAAWRANCTQLAQAMVAGQARNATIGHKAYWELGNEIFVGIAAQNIGAWIVANNLPYPHPNSPYNDNPAHTDRINDRGIIGYQIEYQMALALEAIYSVNATAPAGHRVQILTPCATGSSIAGGASNSWIAALLNYVIVGYEVEKDANGVTFVNTSKPLASSLAGQRFGDLVDLVNVHYIVGANGTTMNTVFNTWTGGTNATTGVFHTEEGGINAAEGGRGGLSAMNNFARAMNVWLTRGLSPADARLIYYASGNGPVGTRGADALTELHGFMPADTSVLTRKPGLLSSGAAVLESYTFENQDATKRALFLLPGNNTATTLTSVTMQAGGWNWTSVTGTARVWSSVTNAASTATVTRAGDGSSYTISFPGVTFTQANQQGLVILLSGASPTALEILTPATLPFGAVNAPYSQTLAAAGGPGSYTWSTTAGALPTGLSLSSAGVLSGTPTVTGTFNFTAQVTDSANTTATRAFSVKINNVTALAFTSIATLRAGVVGVPHEDGISVTGGTAPYTQELTAGAMPEGMFLSSTGRISGTPTTAGTARFTSTVTDAVGATASRNFTLVINAAPPSITTITLPNGDVGAAYSQPLAVTGGIAPYAWTMFSGALPGGLTLSTTGVVEGTPTAGGAFTFAVEVTDSLNTSATKTVAIVIDVPPTGLTALASGVQVALSWTASSSATSYNVKRSTTSGGPYATVASGVTTTSYTDTGLTDGTTYYYVVSAANAGGESVDSAQASATPDITGPVISAPLNIVAEATGPGGAVVSFTATATDAVSGPASVTASPAAGSTFPLGVTTVTLSATDAAGNTSSATFTVTVRDSTAPVITALSASPNSLWPPNKKMVAVTLSAAASDAVTPAPSLQIVSVASNEATDDIDWEITGPLTLNLRAERDGGGSGRIYTITVRATDAAGNSSTATTTVTVPHDQGGKD